MKLIKYFEIFLEDTVNLNKTRYDMATTGIEAITSFLKSNDTLKDYFIGTSPQGSYKQKTIIRPVSEDYEFDVDLLYEMQIVDGWEAKDYLMHIANEFRATDRYKDKVDTKNKSRCVTIDYENDFHIDVIPTIKTDQGDWIMNKNTNQFEITDGDGYVQWFENQTVITNGYLVETVRLIKYIRDAKKEFEAKSILITTLLANQIYTSDAFETFTDLPTTLRILIFRLDQYLQSNVEMPTVTNPVLPKEDFNRHWNQEKYLIFRDAIHGLLAKINSAYLEIDEEESIKKWQVIFGDDFPSSILNLEVGLVTSYRLGDISHAHQLNLPYNNSHTAKIDAYVFTGNTTGTIKKLGGLNSDSRLLSGGLRLKYISKTSAPKPYEVLWQVVNTGPHAASDNGLRGDFFGAKSHNNNPSLNPLENRE